MTMNLDISEMVQINPVTGCWDWIGRISPKGYGWCCGAPAHRVIYVLSGRLIPDGWQIDHLCRNRRCVRLDHLEAVTAEENNARKVPHEGIERPDAPTRGPGSFLRPSELARVYGVSPKTLSRWEAAGTLDAEVTTTPGGHRRYRVTERAQ